VTERLARAAVDVGGGSGAALLLGCALDEIGRHGDADVAFAEAERMAEDDAALTMVAIARSDNMFRGLARPADAKAISTRVEQRVADPDLQAQLVAQRALFAMFEGDVATTNQISESLLSRPGDIVYCIAALPTAMIRTLSGRPREASEIAQRAFEARARLSEAVHLGKPGIYLVARAMALIESGEIDAAIDLAQPAYDAAVADQEGSIVAWFASALGRAHLYTGRLRAALRFGRESAATFGDLDHPGARWGYGLVALAAGQLGEVDVADEALADLDAEPDTPARMMDSELERARAWAAAARGNLPRARAELLTAAAEASDRQLLTWESGLLHDVARLGDPFGVAARLEALRHEVDGDLVGARADFASALAQTDAPRLERAAETFEKCGAVLFAAEAMTEASIAYRKAGATRPATAAARRAQLLVDACDGPRTPSLLHGSGTAVLSKREREVATLASHGMSSRDIASALYVSVRTVENHLQRAYEKLGVTRRSDLAGAMERSGY
jgi:DNA-binding CsgD family transcriptional regulator